MKKYIFTAALASTLLATSCSDSEGIENIIPNGQKEKISFSLSDGSAQTRAGFTGANTRIIARMQSDDRKGGNTKYTKCSLTAAKNADTSTDAFSAVSYADGNTRYWDDAYGRYSLISVYAVAIPNTTDATKLTYDKVKGDQDTWSTEATPDNTMPWSVTQDQSADGLLASEDLVYSNNIQADNVLGVNGVYRYDFDDTHKYQPNDDLGTGATNHYNGCMLFFQDGQDMDTPPIGASSVTDAPGKFDKGHLVFNHALSRITVTLEEGIGFDGNVNNANDFNFNSGNICLINMLTSGTLNIKEGTWVADPAKNITQMASTGTHHGANGTYVAQMLPGYKFKENGNNINVMEFTIDNNTYFITQSMVYDALKNVSGVTVTGNTITMEQGKNYNFKIKVDKKKIESITATLVGWTDVTAETFPVNNTHVKFDLLSATGETCNEGINFYRLKEDLGKIYTDDSYYKTDGKGYKFQGDYKTEGEATLSGAAPYSTNWYYDDNRTAYHFRTISDNAKATLANDGSGTPVKSYFTMTGANTMPDYHWGAPMKAGADLAYNVTEGYKNNIHAGLTSTESALKITEMHMMSNIFITLETTTGSDKVELSGATIKLTRLSNTATVDMGTGYITPAAVADGLAYEMKEPNDYWKTPNVQTNAFQYAAIPQILKRNSGANDNDYVGITITTSDHNQYYVIRKLSEIRIDKIEQGGSSYDDPDGEANGGKIERWYPNHAYHYNIKITKKGIDAITCTVSNWVDVIGENIGIDLES